MFSGSGRPSSLVTPGGNRVPDVLRRENVDGRRSFREFLRLSPDGRQLDLKKVFQVEIGQIIGGCRRAAPDRGAPLLREITCGADDRAQQAAGDGGVPKQWAFGQDR